MAKARAALGTRWWWITLTGNGAQKADAGLDECAALNEWRKKATEYHHLSVW